MAHNAEEEVKLNTGCLFIPVVEVVSSSLDQ